MNTRYKFFKWLKSICDEQMKENYLKPNGGCDSACPSCNVWEHQGNRITTEPLDDGTDKRSCGACGYEWLAIFTPAGFIPLSEYKITNVKEKGDNKC